MTSPRLSPRFGVEFSDTTRVALGRAFAAVAISLGSAGMIALVVFGGWDFLIESLALNFGALAVMLGILTWLMIPSQSHNGSVWALAWAAVFASLFTFGLAVAVFSTSRALPGLTFVDFERLSPVDLPVVASIAVSFRFWPLVPAFWLPLTLGLLLFPDGRPPSPRVALGRLVERHRHHGGHPCHGRRSEPLEHVADQFGQRNRPRHPRQLERCGVHARLDQRCATDPEGRRYGCRTRRHGVRRYGRDTEAAVYFAILEALQNSAKYSEGESVSVSLADIGRDLMFEIRDDGRGFDLATVDAGAGLIVMADRLDTVGGTIRIDSAPGKGTVVTGSVPVIELATA